MFEKGSQIIKAGYNGFKWDGKTYRIEFALGEVISAAELDSSWNRTGEKFKIPAVILEEKDLLRLPDESIDATRDWVRTKA